MTPPFINQSAALAVLVDNSLVKCELSKRPDHGYPKPLTCGLHAPCYHQEASSESSLQASSKPSGDSVCPSLTKIFSDDQLSDNVYKAGALPLINGIVALV